jgi:hypothetical protein
MKNPFINVAYVLILAALLTFLPEHYKNIVLLVNGLGGAYYKLCYFRVLSC